MKELIVLVKTEKKCETEREVKQRKMVKHGSVRIERG